MKEKSNPPLAEVPQKYAPNHSLGIWVNKQRMEYKKFKESKISSMTEWKIKELEEVGFVFMQLRYEPRHCICVATDSG